METTFQICHQSQPDLQGKVCYYVNVLVDGNIIDTVGVEKYPDGNDQDTLEKAEFYYNLQLEQQNGITLEE
jgi:hypothetical protein